MPALFTRTSMWPKVSHASRATRSASSRSPKSAAHDGVGLVHVIALEHRGDASTKVTGVAAVAADKGGGRSVEDVGRSHVHVARHHGGGDSTVAVEGDARPAQLAALLVAEPDPT